MYILTELPRMEQGERLPVTCVSLNDPSRDLRLEWITSCNLDLSQKILSPGEAYLIPSMDSHTDVQIVSGNDVPRLRRVFEMNPQHFSNALAICVMNRSSAIDRSVLLHAGYDDVIDINRCTRQEFYARISAMLWRINMTRKHIAREQGQANFINKVAFRDKLGKSEAAVMNAFAESPNNYLSLSSISFAIKGNYGLMTRKHIQVMISTLRKKLRFGADIVWQDSEGYKLVYRG